MAIDPNDTLTGTQGSFLNFASTTPTQSPFVESPSVISPVVGAPSILDQIQEAPDLDTTLPLWKQRELERSAKRKRDRAYNKALQDVESRYLGSEDDLVNFKGIVEDIKTISDKYTDRQLKKYAEETYGLGSDSAELITTFATTAPAVDWSFLEPKQGIVTVEDVVTPPSSKPSTDLGVPSVSLQPTTVSMPVAGVVTGGAGIAASNVINSNRGIVSFVDNITNTINTKATEIVAGGAVNAKLNTVLNEVNVPLTPGKDALSKTLAEEKLKMDTATSSTISSTAAKTVSAVGAIVSIDAFLKDPNLVTGIGAAAGTATALATIGGYSAAATAAAVLNPLAIGVGVVSYFAGKKGSTFGHADIGYADIVSQPRFAARSLPGLLQQYGEEGLKEMMKPKPSEFRFKITGESSKNKGFTYTLPEANAATLVLNELVDNYGFEVDQAKLKDINTRIDFDKGRFYNTSNTIVADMISKGALKPTASTPADIDWKDLFTSAREQGQIIFDQKLIENGKIKGYESLSAVKEATKPQVVDPFNIDWRNFNFTL
jgi:hypothetical protein